ncbi:MULTISPECIES: dynamin family protein [unclassified Microcoleus]|uniref:dynamin family protein n=1 Tax=unclassified Microcoleus TaxID=2642155 RepID=UPI001DF441C3|nr:MULTISPECIES: dynamin family protein [unclassified Microcoleus]MCC3506092.1 dynamin family protein [Microcoleus sp. PH2017_19_SFW_U_A]TAG91217.1 MAG: dynamin [Oscillatoriales cyanobacterium]MCC3475925.1 dynamin family protein [Microcoleus sp. PH2017_13_LAR_U_A]MCC3488452.1 dynamin family protein [Microcoleus sp. PH2017_14_LAR_D_A]MCC3500607.1 dynamin family protein [Microcoleus sp. PH2017_15_JOR_U_A]
MQQPETYQNLTNYLKSALGILELDKNSQLYRDTTSICDYLAKPTFQIAVFGPFNYGKSTLLNALLGNRALPIDLVPTTGAAIYVNYGDELHAKITLKDGTEVSEAGTDVLKRYAILDDNRQMRDDVAAVNVYCPHPFLKTGVELLDLPGTNDRQEQDNLVRDKLLTADLVVQVLDARKLMTLGEREHLRDWLSDRQINTVVFVANFLNLLEPEDQKQVYNRLLFVAESFRSNLPNNISNIYRVDALPALRARLKGDVAAAQTTGIAMFESALQSIVASQQEQLAVKLPRIEAIATKICQSLRAKSETVATEITAAQQKQKDRIEIKQKAEKLISQGFQASVSDFEIWLYQPTLLRRYQSEMALSLQQGSFDAWKTKFEQDVLNQRETIAEWVNKACEFFDREQPIALLISFPPSPQIALPEPPTAAAKRSIEGEVTPVAIATGLGWLLGGPMGAAVVGGASYILKKRTGYEKPPESSEAYLNQVTEICNEAAKNYLIGFSIDTFLMLQHYKEIAAKVICFQDSKEPLNMNVQQYQLQLVNNLVENLAAELDRIKIR